MKLKIAKPEDRDAVIKILASNGYSVCELREIRDGTTTCYVKIFEEEW